MVKKITLLCIFFANIFNESYSQRVSNQYNSFKMPTPDIKKLLDEDKLNELDKTKPYRFGISYDVLISIHHQPNLEILPNGKMKSTFTVKADTACKSLNFRFKVFSLSEDAQLIIKNAKGEKFLGTYTYQHNSKLRVFSTGILLDSIAIFELYENIKPAFESELVLDQITYGYKSLLKSNFGLGNSGSCNVNTICPEGNNWRDQIQSVAMIVEGGFAGCSGALIANTCKNTTPYFLTANHCLTGDENSWVFLFNWESPDCSTNTAGSLNHTISGSQVISSSSWSDFALLELSATPPDSFNVFYSGWNRQEIPALQATAIHHPAGDVKKISFENDPLTTSGNFWRVNDWDMGTTEGGSSGSPLYNEQKQIVGQLYGGWAACGNDEYDSYGKFSKSWDYEANASQHLKTWLDACNTDEIFIDGYNPASAVLYNRDIQLVKIINVAEILCYEDIEPQIVVKNVGIDTVLYFEAFYQTLDTFNTVNFSCFLLPGMVDTFLLPSIPNITQSEDTLHITVFNPNGLVDLNLSNNTLQKPLFSFIDPVYVRFQLLTDSWGSEVSWNIQDSTSRIFYESPFYPDVTGGVLYSDSFCLNRNTCYTFTINDSYGDGLSLNTGYYLLQNSYFDTLAYILNVNYGFQETQSFCVVDTTYVIYTPEYNEILSKVQVYPNPNNGVFYVKHDYFVQSIEIYDLTGRIIYTNSTLHQQLVEVFMPETNGLYLLRVLYKDGNAQQFKIISNPNDY